MEDIKTSINSFMQEVYYELDLLKQTKYGIFSDVAIMNLRTKVNIYNFRFLYVMLCGICVFIGIVIKPFTLLLLLMQAIPIVIYKVCTKLNISIPINLPQEFPPSFIAICIGYISASITAYFNDCFLPFLLPLVIAVIIIRAHSCFAITDAEPEHPSNCCSCQQHDHNHTTSESECNCCEGHKEIPTSIPEDKKED
ncbi:hypothetical protein CL6EHI_159820 [Entamoeba histolytica]|nr:hypothetical protein CL6EHI_159820 [Entamoeba histolytica]